jgi:hypothetical protein
MQPVRAQACLICMATLKKKDGRKMYLEASIDDLDTGDHYIDASSLFINMKTAAQLHGDEGGPLPKKPPADLDMGGSDPTQWHTEPRYMNILKGIGM